jgi:ABC-type transport system substrate-binding protein
MQLPDASLGLDSFKPDQCTRVPTIDNGDEDPLGRWTSLRLDPRAVWSDGKPVTADDYLFTQHIYADPHFAPANLVPAYTLMHLTALDAHTIRIDWSSPYGDYLFPLTYMWPLPLHVYATGQFAGVYNPLTGAYNSTLAQRLLASLSDNTTIPVDDGPFTVQSFVFNDRAVLVRNPRFFSNFFHHPAALDRITLVLADPDLPVQDVPTLQNPTNLKIKGPLLQQDLITRYRKGEVQVVDGLTTGDLSLMGGIPTREKISSPDGEFGVYAFNQRSTAPNAAANGGTSIFTDPAVRKAFVQAFDRCAALTLPRCSDSSQFTNELSSPPSPDYDPTFRLPPFDPVAAAAALDHAKYRVGADGIRRARDGKTPLQLILAIDKLGDDYDFAVRMQQDWQRYLHVRVTLVRYVEGSDRNSPFGGGVFDIWLSGESIIMDPTDSLLVLGGGWDRADIPSAQNPNRQNVFGLIDPYVVERSQLGSQIQDQAQRNALYTSLQRYVSGLLDIVPRGLTADVALVKPTLCNYQKSATLGAGSNLWNMADWYVAPSCPA